MNEQEVLEVFRTAGAIITDDHIVYTSGLHGTAYINKDAVYPHTAEISRLCRALAERFACDFVDVIAAPAVGGVILSQWVAHHLSELSGREVLAVYAEKETMTAPDPSGWGRSCHVETGSFVIKRGYDKFITNKRVLVVEDILTTGGSAKKVVKKVRAIGGSVVGLGALCNRGGVLPHDVADVPKLSALLTLQFDTWNVAQCPLCKQNIPVNTDVGKGREFRS